MSSSMAQMCIICLENHTTFIKLQCECTFCYPCIRSFLSNILKDQSRYPWRCCEVTVERDIVAPALTDTLAHDWDARHVQYLEHLNLIPKCAWEGCGAIITHDRMTVYYASCHRCFRETCMVCRRESHGSQACPESAAEARELGMIETENLQRCYQCRAMVQRNQGCNHMT